MSTHQITLNLNVYFYIYSYYLGVEEEEKRKVIFTGMMNKKTSFEAILKIKNCPTIHVWS